MVFGLPVLSFLIWFPIVLGILLGITPGRSAWLNRLVAAIASVALLGVSLQLFITFNLEDKGLSYSENAEWLPSIGLNYTLGLDGLSIFMVLVTSLVFPIAFLVTREPRWRDKWYVSWLLMLEGGLFGALLSLDLILFFVFWEFLMIPTMFLVGLWGGEKRRAAATKYFLMMFGAGAILLAAFVYVAWKYAALHSGTPSFVLDELIGLPLSWNEQVILFIACLIGLGIKAPMFPLHTWLPDIQESSSTAVSVALSLEIGVYALIRFGYVLFPDGAMYLAPFVAFLGVVGIIYGALAAWAQTDIKRLLAYGSVAHMGACLLGMAAANETALTGAILLMGVQSFVAATLFALFGYLIDGKADTSIASFSGIASLAPRLSTITFIALLTSIVLPLTASFAGEILVFIGSYQRFPLLTAIALMGSVLSAVYMLGLFRDIFYGEQTLKEGIIDLQTPAFVTSGLAVAFMLYLGLVPEIAASRIRPAIASVSFDNKDTSSIKATQKQNGKDFVKDMDDEPLDLRKGLLDD